jgi:uncharacterized membrane protein YhdT
MTDRVKTPWHLWVVGVVAVAWNAFGCWDYTMTHLKGEAHLRAFGMTDAQIAYFDAMPAWTHATWAIGVWGGLLGAVLLLLRRRWALHAFVLSFLGFVGGLIYSYGLSDASAVMGPNAWMMNALIGGACILFIWYAWAMAKKGVLV